MRNVKALREAKKWLENWETQRKVNGTLDIQYVLSLDASETKLVQLKKRLKHLKMLESDISSEICFLGDDSETGKILSVVLMSIQAKVQVCENAIENLTETLVERSMTEFFSQGGLIDFLDTKRTSLC